MYMFLQLADTTINFEISAHNIDSMWRLNFYRQNVR